ncbi:hypothetical protein, partial [Klebsiella pneumoniae]|uniref:hypothetical protein n=1 Tax=Klebsiella pneumoniae TaxID=573 RepID=UPI003B9856E7
YQAVTGGKFLMQRPWPDFSSLPVDQAAFDEMEWVIRLISEVRTTRNEMNVPAAAKIPLFLNGASGLSHSRLATHRDAIL